MVALYIAQYQQDYPSRMPDLLLKSTTRLDKISAIAEEITLIHISDGTSKIHLRNTQTLSRFHFQHPESKIICINTDVVSSSKKTNVKSLQNTFPVYQSKNALSVTQGRLPVTFYTDKNLNIQAVHEGELSYTKLLGITNLDR